MATKKSYSAAKPAAPSTPAPVAAPSAPAAAAAPATAAAPPYAPLAPADAPSVRVLGWLAAGGLRGLMVRRRGTLNRG